MPTWTDLQSVLRPGSPEAAATADLWWLMLAISSVVYVAVVAALLYGMWRRRADPAEPSSTGESSRGPVRAVSAATALTVVILFVLLVLNFRTGRALTAAPPADALRVDVTGHQWWWEVEYQDSIPSRQVTTANEIHVPVGREVVIVTRSVDVIHSIWMPNLSGKRDLIPGYVGSIAFRADTPGVYRGQCAEFCGHGHAKMAFTVVAEPEAEFADWLHRQRQPAPPAADSASRRGEAVFLSSSCAMCHTIRGTPAGGKFGPELTHLASRRTIAAGTLPNTRGHLAGWIVDPQRIKPGVRMPPNALSPDDLEALLTYLMGLQ